MQISKQSKQRKRWYLLSLFLLILLLGWVGYNYSSAFFKEREEAVLQHQIAQKQQEIENYQTTTWIDHLLSIDQMISERNSLPRNEYIEKILEILNKIKAVDDQESKNIFLSDFKVDLEKLSLNGFVGNLSTLYYNSDKSDGFVSLLDRFEQLDFLKEIEIKTYQYQKEKELRGFNFTLHANIEKNDGSN